MPPSRAAPGRAPAETDRYRAFPSPLAPFAAIVPPYSRPSRTSPPGGASSVLDRRSTRRRSKRAAGAEGWLRRDRTKGWDVAGRKHFFLSWSPHFGVARDEVPAAPSNELRSSITALVAPSCQTPRVGKGEPLPPKESPWAHRPDAMTATRKR